MTSVYGVRLYELLAQWQFKGEREVSLDWLRQQFRIPDQYREVGDLKKRVIDPAVDQINSHSDLWVKYGQRKAGRTVVALQFQFGPKAEKQVTQEKPGSAPKHQLDRTYIEAHARPGETWEQAIARLSAGETGKLPGGV